MTNQLPTSNEEPKIVSGGGRRFSLTTLQHEKFNEECLKGTAIELHSKDWVAISRTQYSKLALYRREAEIRARLDELESLTDNGIYPEDYGARNNRIAELEAQLKDITNQSKEK